MSSRVDLLRARVESFNRGDLDTFLADVDDDYEWVTVAEHPSAATHRGAVAIRAYIEDWTSTIEGMRFEIDSIEEHGDQVLTGFRVLGGPEGGPGTEVTITSVTTFRGETPVRTEEFFDPADARRALENPSRTAT